MSLPPSAPSPAGRRVLVAVVTGDVGERIQAWRLEHDPEQADRLPPHTTLCYVAPEPSAALGLQIRHAFPTPVTVTLGDVHEFDNADHTFYLNVVETQDLDAARQRLYDGKYLSLRGQASWTWHVTCIRYGARRDLEEVRRLTADFKIVAPWSVDRVALLELQGARYEELAAWRLTPPLYSSAGI
jgi:2'-5' RNA ligase